jgi:hypothetical protein
MASKKTKKIFNLRKRFLSKIVSSSEHDNFYDSSLVNHYGKVDYEGNIIYPSEKHLSTLPNPNKVSGNTYYALNFVTQAFKDFREYYIKGISTGIIKNDKTNLLEPIRAWQSMHVLYAQNVEFLYEEVINDYMQSPNEAFGATNSYPKNFDDFVKSFKNLLSFAGSDVKLSRSSFILSTQCPLSTTGLAIEIAPDIGISNTSKVVSNFYDDPNFDFYMRALKKFGFMADVDYPGRIVADIGSPVMQQYMENYGFSFDNLFEVYYYKAKDYDYDLIKVYLYQFYNSYVTDYPIKTIIKNRGTVRSNKFSIDPTNFRQSSQPRPTANTRLVCEKTTTEVIQRMRITQSDLEDKYDNSYWLNIYAEMLNYELGSVLDATELTKALNNAQDLNKNVDIDSARGYINSVFKMFRFPRKQKLKIPSRVNTSTQTTEPSTTTSSGGSSSGGGGY